MVPQEVVLFLTLEVVLFLTLEGLKSGTETIGSAKTDPVRFKWGFREEDFLKDKFALFEAYKSPIPKRRKTACKTHILIKQKGPLLKTPLNWTGSVFSTPETNSPELHYLDRNP